MASPRSPYVCVRCGTEWRPDYADQSLTDTPEGPVCVSRWDCDRRVRVRESLAKLRPVRTSEYRPAP